MGVGVMNVANHWDVHD